MKIDREKFLNALNLVSPGLSERDVVEQSGCFVFSGGKVFTFNDEIACSCDVDLKIEGAVKAAELQRLLSKMKEEHLDISDNQKEIYIKGKGNRRAGIIKEAEIQMPLSKLEIPKKWKKLSEEFSEAVDFVHECAGTDDANFSLTCVHVHPEFLEAFDNWKFARYYTQLDLKSEFLVRQASIKTIVSMAMTRFSEGKDWVHFKNDSGLVLSCRRWKDEYIDLTPLTKVQGETITLPKGLIDAAERALILSEKNTHSSAIRMDISSNEVAVLGEGPYGWYREKKKVEYSGPTFSFMIHPNMLIALLKRETRCSISDKVLVVKGGKRSIYVTSLMPALNVNKKKKGKK